MCRPVYSLLGSPSMRKLVIAALILFPVVAVGWQVGSAEVSNYEFHDDLGYIAAQSRVNIGLQSPETDDQVRNDVIASAAEDGIRLRPDQVQVKRVTITFPRNPPLTHYDVAVSYAMPVNLLLYSFHLHFHQAIAKRGGRTSQY